MPTRKPCMCHPGPLPAAVCWERHVSVGGYIFGEGQGAGYSQNRFLSGSCSRCWKGACDRTASRHPGCLRALLFTQEVFCLLRR